jgi:hypothetical protein
MKLAAAVDIEAVILLPARSEAGDCKVLRMAAQVYGADSDSIALKVIKCRGRYSERPITDILYSTAVDAH